MSDVFSNGTSRYAITDTSKSRPGQGGCNIYIVLFANQIDDVYRKHKSETPT